MSYFSVHNHSEFSNIRLLDSTNKVEHLFERAIELGLTGFALTDHEVLSGSVQMVQQFKKLKEEGKLPEGFKIALGNEVYLIDDKEDYIENYSRDTHKYYHFVLLAKNERGWRALKELSSTAWANSYMQNGMYRVPLTKPQLEETMKRFKGDIVASTACLGGELAQHILTIKEMRETGQTARETEVFIKMNQFISWCVEVFGEDNFFLEIQPNHGEEQIYVNKVMKTIAEQTNLDIIYTTDSHYIDKEARFVHKAFLNAMDGEREVDAFYSSTYMMGAEEVYSYMKDYVTEEEFQQWTDNTNKIYDMIEMYDLYQPQSIPSIDVQDYPKISNAQEYEDFPALKTMLEGECLQDRYWANTCIKELKNRDIYNDRYLQRLNDEAVELLGISDKLGIPMTQYYNTMQKIIEIIWEDGNSLVGPARGSATGFLSCYLLDITQVDPIETNLPYWRHLSATRPELPDIDIDTEQNKRERILYAIQQFFNRDVPEMYNHLKDHWNVLNVATFGTEAPRSAVITACRGYRSEEYPEGIDSDDAHYLTGMIPNERGRDWPLEDVIFGNEEKGRKPVAEFNRELSKYEGLQDIILSISGLVNKRSSHAAGVYIYNNGFLEHNAMMKTPSGQAITQFDMDDSDYMGSLKYDFLTIEALDKIRVALDLLIEDGFIENKGSLKKTYDSYLHPDVLDYDHPKIWELFGANEVVNLFQFDTPVGAQCVQKIQPKSLTEVAAANSLMRLMAGPGEEQPIDRFIRFKEDRSQWYDQMRSYNLTEEEINLVVSYLNDAHGVAATQEDLMEIVMDPEIANFNLTEANKLRKGIAKISAETTAEVKTMFYEKGHNAGTRKNLLDYIWEEQIKPQLGYSFSRNHTTPYSLIALQEVYLYYNFPNLYWNTAALTVNSQSMEEDEIPGVEKKTKSTNYDKMASAIGNMKSFGVEVSLPDINKSDLGFKVDLEGNRILFGLKGVTRIGDDLVKEIIENRPYTSIQDFREKVKVNVLQMVNLIKSGAFDSVYPGLSRKEIMAEFIKVESEPKKVLNLRNFNGLINADLVPDELEFSKRVYGYTQILRRYFREGEYYSLENEQLLDFYNQHFDTNLLDFIDDKFVINSKTFDNKIYQTHMDPVRVWLKNDQEKILKKYNNHLFQEMWDKYAEGNDSAWEMESVSFYHSEHELAHVNKEFYGISDFKDLPRTPEVERWYFIKGKQIPIYKLTKIVGTVLGKNKSNGTISLLTTNEVITARFRKSYFALFDKQLSETREDGTKKITERSWFNKGNKLMITGYRRGDEFVPKTYANTQSHTLYRIDHIDENGKMELRSER